MGRPVGPGPGPGPGSRGRLAAWPTSHGFPRCGTAPTRWWFALTEILRGAYGEFVGRLFGRYADSRETQAALREPAVHHAQGPVPGERLGIIDPESFLIFCNDQLPFHDALGRSVRGELEASVDLTVDYVADIGDGFSPIFTIARQMAAPVTPVTGADGTSLVLPRAKLIVMGGDEVYPAAGAEHYRDRTIGSYRTAFPPESSTGPDLDLRWVDGRPVVEGRTPQPALIDTFTVLAGGGGR